MELAKVGNYGQIPFGQYLDLFAFSRTWAKHYFETGTAMGAWAEANRGDKFSRDLSFGHYVEAAVMVFDPEPEGHFFSKINEMSNTGNKGNRKILMEELEAEFSVGFDGADLPLQNILAVAKEVAGVQVVFGAERLLCEKMLQALDRKPKIKKMLECLEAQSTFVADCFNTRAKVRPDIVNHDLGIIVDVKTARDASREGFGRDGAKFGYYLQMGMYPEVMRVVTGLEYGFLDVVFQKEKFIDVAIYSAEPEVFAEARRQVQVAADAWERTRDDFLAKRETEGYPDEVVMLKPPGYWYGRGR